MRIRSYKPCIFAHEALWDAGPVAFQLFLGLISLADREGRFRWRPRSIKAAVLPYWDGSIDDAMMGLVKAGLVLRYQADSEPEDIGLIVNFTKHQQPYHREQASVLPGPARTSQGHGPDKAGLEPVLGKVVAAQEQEQEQEQKEKKGGSGSRSGPSARRSLRELPLSPGVAEVWEHYEKLHPRVRVRDAKTTKLIADRLREGFTPAEIIGAIDAQHADPFYRGQNDRKKTYLDLEIVVRDGVKVRKLLESSAPKPADESRRLT